MSCTAQASPNIAFLKYWGKRPASNDREKNIGLNPSLSMTLSQACTQTRVERATQTSVWINERPANEKDFLKVQAHLDRVCDFFKFAPAAFTVRSTNNFPQGTGIASSASAFAALTFALVGEILGPERAPAFCREQLELLSELARRGSGSACRSVSGPYMQWDGPFAQVVSVPWKLYDTIVIFSKEHKKIPSTLGHELALSSPAFAARLKNISARREQMMNALLKQNLNDLGPLLEIEADEMHTIAATSIPPVVYATPATTQFLEALRSQSTRNFFYTLDAGPNVHLLSEKPIRTQIETLLTKLQLEAEIWEDWTGAGPVLIFSP